MNLIKFGALEQGLVGSGQYFRFFTTGFLHGGLIHLFFCSFALLELGKLCIQVFGNTVFVYVYFASILCGSVASYLSGVSLSVGSSGGLFGLCGFIVSSVVFHPKVVSSGFRQGVIKVLVPVIVLNLLLGLIIPKIDNAGHLGGLFFGAFAGIMILPKPYKNNFLAGLYIWLIIISQIVSYFSYEETQKYLRIKEVELANSQCDFWVKTSCRSVLFNEAPIKNESPICNDNFVASKKLSLSQNELLWTSLKFGFIPANKEGKLLCEEWLRKNANE